MSRRNGLCDRSGCRAPAAWAVSIEVFGEGDVRRTSPSRLRVDLVACSGHARQLRPEDVVSAAAWPAIEATFIREGRRPPRRESARVALTPFVPPRPQTLAAQLADVVGRAPPGIPRPIAGQP